MPQTAWAKAILASLTLVGLYVCNVLLFGMKNALASPQQQMNTITTGLSSVVTYNDDLVVCSSLWEELFIHLRQLCNRLSEAGLFVNLRKYEF